MAESRRVPLTSLSCDVPSSSDQPASAPRSPPGVLQVKGSGSERPADTGTVRLELTLFEPDERSFPEFSYSHLVDSETNHTKDEVPLSRFEEEEKRANDEVAAISRKLEEKYGGEPNKKKDRIQDLIDIGYGYDDGDSFIDNSEAYDEFVPASITTKFGGFYINSGVLQFRQESETEDVTTDKNTLEHPKKRKVNSRQDKPKKKRCREGEEGMMNVDPKSSTLSENGPDDETKKKKKKAISMFSVTSMLKKFQREKEKERQKMAKAHQRAAAVTGGVTIPLCPADAGGGGGSGLTDPLLSLIGSTNDHALIQAANAVDFDIDLDSLLDVSEGTLSPKTVPQPAAELFKPQIVDLTQSDAVPQVQPSDNSQVKPHSEQIQLLSQTRSTSPLPEGLPPRLEESIRKLMVVTKTSEGESKLKFFTPEINSILLDIELQCRQRGVQLRSKVYTHLSSFLPCSRDTLLKRVKKLLLAHMEEPPDVQDPMQRLKEAIGKAMPEQIACFHEICQAYEQVRTSKAAEEEKEGKEKVSVGSEDNVEEKGGKRGGGPKKLFKWDEEIRESLCQVLKVKMESYKKERKGSQEMEEYLKTLLDNEVKPLWPKGWMQSRVLIRESRKMLSLFTPLPIKKARPEKKQSSVPGPRTVSDGCSVLQGSPTLTGLYQEADNVFTESSNIPNSTPALKKMEGETGVATVSAGSSTSAEADKPLLTATPSPTHSHLNPLADQALAREQPLSVSKELLLAAIAKYRHSVQPWSFGTLDTKSPPLPPPPPHSSPVDSPLSGMYHVVLPQLLQVGDFSRHTDADQVQVISDDDDDDDDDIIIQ